METGAVVGFIGGALVLLIIAIGVIAFSLMALEQQRVAEGPNKLKVGMTKQEVMGLLALPRNYSTNSDGSMCFITKLGSCGIVQERVIVSFDENERVESWNVQPF